MIGSLHPRQETSTRGFHWRAGRHLSEQAKLRSWRLRSTRNSSPHVTHDRVMSLHSSEQYRYLP